MRSALAVPAVILSILMLAASSSSLASDEKAAPAAARIQVAFKLDPRLSGPTYGGERWVSPPTYTGASAQDTVEARALAVDASRRPTKVTPEWTPSDPDMVTVSPPRGEQVKITVKRAGESSVTVKSGGASRKLVVKAVQTNGNWQVSISQ
jgi:hypothetical protein